MADSTAPFGGALGKILDALGLGTLDVESAAESDAYRIDFEEQFTVEIQRGLTQDCRISARVFNLGKSLQVQEQQLKRAIQLFSELIDDLPECISLGISDHDNCLRICVEIADTNADQLMKQFHGFVHVAFAYKQTYLKHQAC
jgi:hypothetical protein